MLCKATIRRHCSGRLSLGDCYRSADLPPNNYHNGLHGLACFVNWDIPFFTTHAVSGMVCIRLYVCMYRNVITFEGLDVES